MPTHALAASLRRRLLEGEVCAGPFLKIPAAEVTELAALAGFDLVVVDLEHSPFSMETAVAVIRAAAARGIDAVVRTTENTGAEIGRALDAGAAGLIVPHVGSVEDAREVVGHARFGPLGERGMDLYARAAGWGETDRDTYLRHANEEILVGVMVEGSAAINDLADIAEVEGLDLLFVGPYDLSQSMGYPGQIDHPEVVRAIEQAAATADEHGRVLGMYVDDVDTAARYRDLGVRFIGMANDADILRQAFRLVTDGFAGATDRRLGPPLRRR
jgi:4-hydroxy-2-oxoheptanedioate aldolase